MDNAASRERTQRTCIIPFFLIVAVSAVAGCARRAESPAEHASGEASKAYDGTPRELLKSTFTRYRNATSYHDQGRVRLTYQADGESHSEIAPLRVRLDRDSLDVAAYDVRLRQIENRLNACIVDPTSNHFDSQVLERPVPGGRPQLDSILSDSILAARMQAGLAGPPPQLEWLLADESMARLFDDDYEFAFGNGETVEGHRCHVIRVDAQGDRFQLWIDERLGVIRRVDLPLSSLPISIPSSSSMKLTLELSGATFRSRQQQIEPIPLPARPRYVRRFVPLPPIEPSRILGARPNRYRLADRNGNVRLDAERNDKRIQVLGRFSGSDAELGSLAILQAWNTRLPPEVSSKTAVIVVVDRSALGRLPLSLQLPIAIDEDQTADRQLALEPGGLVILDPQGRIAWFQPYVTSETLVAAGAVIGDLMKGVDVPERLREQWRGEVRAYQDAIAEAAVGAML